MRRWRSLAVSPAQAGAGRDAARVVVAVARAAGDEEANDRGADVDSTDRRQAAGDEFTGWPTLADIIGEDVVGKVREWLGIGRDSSDGNAAEAQEAEGPGDRESQAAAIARMAAESAAEAWHTPDGTAYVTVPLPATKSAPPHSENWPVKGHGSGALRDWLTRLYYVATGRPPQGAALQSAVETIGAGARFDGAEHEVHLRLALHDGKVYLDLCAADWRVVEVDGVGWRVVPPPPGLKFRRRKGMLPLPEPQADTSGTVLSEFRALCNVPDDDWPLVVAWLVMAGNPHGEYPILDLLGEFGTGKTNLCRMLRRVWDPNKSELRSQPRDERDLVIAANNSWVLALENISTLPTWLSNALCRISTGAAFSTRKLYEDDEEMLFEVERPALINGIEEVISRPDLLSRTIIAAVQPLRRTLGRRGLMERFDAVHPRLLGRLLTAVSCALAARWHDREADGLPRMADFYNFITAAEPALSFAVGTFDIAYRRSIAGIHKRVLDDDAYLVGWVVQLAGFEGTATDLLARVNALAVTAELDPKELRRQGALPRKPRELADRLRRLGPNLRATEQADVRFGHDKHKNVGTISISACEHTGGTAPPDPLAPRAQNERGTGAGQETGQRSAHFVSDPQAGRGGGGAAAGAGQERSGAAPDPRPDPPENRSDSDHAGHAGQSGQSCPNPNTTSTSTSTSTTTTAGGSTSPAPDRDDDSYDAILAERLLRCHRLTQVVERLRAAGVPDADIPATCVRLAPRSRYLGGIRDLEMRLGCAMAGTHAPPNVRKPVTP
jgi:hypothetical protein